MSPHQHCLSFGIGTSCLLSSLLMASTKETHSLRIYSSFAWKNSPQLSTAPSWDPIQISAYGLHISHLLFADDVLLFTKAKNSQLRFITEMFSRFSQASGLKINLSKSRAFYSWSTPHAKVNRLTSITGIRSTTSFDKYLGFPILKGRAKHSDFLFIIEKKQSRLASWKHRLLNKPGRVTLASSVLSSIPYYYM